MPRKRRRKTASPILSKKRKKTIKHKLKVVALAVFSVVITVFLLLGVSVYKFVNAPFSTASYVSDQEGEKLFNERTTLILAIVEDIDNPYSEITSLALMDFNSEAKRYYIYHLPVDYEIEYPLNYGKGPISRIYAVGNSDQNRGMYLLDKAILRFLAVKTDGYVLIDKQGYSKFLELIGEVDENDLSAVFRLKNTYKIPEMITLFRNSAITNGKFSDLFDFYSFIKNTSETSSDIYYITKFHLDEIYRWDLIWRENHMYSDLQKEGVKVFVANAGIEKIGGLASWGARVVENAGAGVFSIENSEVTLQENTIITNNVELNTVMILKDILGITNVLTIDEISNKNEYNPEIFRTDVSILLVNF